MVVSQVLVLRAGVGKIDGNKERAAAGGKPVRAGDAGLGDGRGRRCGWADV